MALDPRVHAYRPDIADVALAGQLFAPHYARPMMRLASESARGVFSTPSEQAAVVTELRKGDEFAVLDVTGGWAWGYRRLDHCVGYVPEMDLLALDRD